jgi:hypothetical protein
VSHLLSAWHVHLFPVPNTGEQPPPGLIHGPNWWPGLNIAEQVKSRFIITEQFGLVANVELPLITIS